jgi:hypothetical protein
MEFRWVAAIAVWTILSGPIFNGKGSLYAPSPDRASAKAVKSSTVSKQPLVKIETNSRTERNP